MVEKNRIIDGSRIKEGDALIGIASSGLHSNGYSLVRKLLNPNIEKLSEYISDLGTTLGEELLKPTRIYVKTVKNLLGKFDIKGISHITGGGFYENIPRMLPEGLRARVFRQSWTVPPIFQILQEVGNVREKEMYNTFNMGIGLVMAVEKDAAGDVLSFLASVDEKASIIGEVVKGEAGVDIC